MGTNNKKSDRTVSMQEAEARVLTNCALVTLSSVGISTPAETYGDDLSWAISDLCRAVVRLTRELSDAKDRAGRAERIIERVKLAIREEDTENKASMYDSPASVT